MRYLLIPIILLFTIPVFAQDHDEHDHASNEIGLGFGASYNIQENEWAPGIHAHYLRYFGEHNTYGLSGGFETILDEHKHNSLTVGFHYRLFDLVTLGLSPGISKSTQETAWEFVTHFEVVSEFELGFLHLGPMLEYAIGIDHSHLMCGVHIGFGF